VPDRADPRCYRDPNANRRGADAVASCFSPTVSSGPDAASVVPASPEHRTSDEEAHVTGAHVTPEPGSTSGLLEQRQGRGGEDVTGVCRGEIDGAVHLEHVTTAGLVADQIDAREVEPECGDRATRKVTCCGRRTDAPAGSAESDVRAP